MSAETLATIATCIAILSGAYVIGEKIFGGGNKLAAKFGSLELQTTNDINALSASTTHAINTLSAQTTTAISGMRLETHEKFEQRDNERRIGLDAITSNIHALQTGLLEFRVKMAEEYMRRDSYYKASEELKNDFKEKHDDLKAEMHQGFMDVKAQIGAVAQSIEAGRKQARSSHA